MRQLIIQIPGHHNVSSDLIARIVAEICTEASVSIESALVNQWGDSEATSALTEEATSALDEVLHKSIDVVNDVAGANGIETVANILSIMQDGPFDSREKLKNAIVALTEYSKPSRLMQPPFRLKGYIFNSIKLLHDKHLI